MALVIIASDTPGKHMKFFNTSVLNVAAGSN
jgi:hypothetical protein